MTNDFVPYARSYLEILKILGEWKILNFKEIGELYHGEISYKNLHKKVRKLERHGFLRGLTFKGKTKHFFLTSLGVKFSLYPHAEEVNEKNLTRSLFAAQVLREFLKWPACLEGKILSSRAKYGLCPDAEITLLLGGGQKIKVALEIELYRKSYGRMMEKFGHYRRNLEYDRVLFITRHEHIFRGYRSYLIGMREDIQKKIAVVLERKLSIEKFDFRKSLCLYREKMTDFFSIFCEFQELTSVEAPPRPCQIPQ